MADSKYPKESFSVDDILNEVRAMKSKTMPEPIKTSAAPKAETKADSAAEKTADKNDENIIEKAKKESDNLEMAAKIADEVIAVSEDKHSYKHGPSMITPDEISNGFDSGSIHVNNKHTPNVMTADEVRKIKIKTTEDKPKKQNVAFEKTDKKDIEAENDKLKQFFSKTTESTYVGDKDKAKRQIDALFEDDENAVSAPVFNKKKRNANVLSPEEIMKSTAVGVKGKKTEPSHDDSSKATEQTETAAEYHEETKAERKARLKEERENEKIRRSEEKARREVERHLSKSKARVEELAVKTEPTPVAPVPANNDALPKDESTKQAKEPKADRKKKNRRKMGTAEPQKVNSIPIIDEKTGTKVADFSGVEIPKSAPKYEEKIVKQNFRAIRAGKIEFDKTDEDSNKKDDVIDDYRTIDDAESVRVGLDAKIASLSSKSAFTLLMFVLLAIFTLLPCLGVNLPTLISPEQNVTAYLSINLVLFIITVIINAKTVVNGLFSLIRLKPDIDTAVSLSTVAALVQSILALYLPNSFAQGKGYLFTAVAAAALYFNLRGKKCMFTRVRSNFELVATTGVKQSCFALKSNRNKFIVDNEAIGKTTISCSRPVLNLHDYLYNSFCEDSADRMNMILAPIGLIVAIITGCVAYYFNGDMMNAVGTVAVVTAMFVPLTSVLATNRPLKSAGKKVREFGGLLSGYNAIEDFSDVEYAVINDEDMFPSGTVELLQLKSVGDASIDDVIMDAAALVIAAGGPLADVFDRMIEGRSKSLKPVSGIMYTDGVGLSGSVGFDTISVGNRAMIEKTGDINLPDIEMERKIKRNNCFAVYIARNDELCGMLVVKYNEKEPEMSQQLQRLTQNGVTLLVKTSDPNVTESLVRSTFSLGENTVKIMPAHSVKVYEEFTAARESGDSVIAHQNSLTGYAAALVAAKRLKLKLTLAIVLQTVGTVLGAAFCVFMSLTVGYAAIVPTMLLGYQLICAILTLVIPSFRKV